MQVHITVSPGYRFQIASVSRVSEFANRLLASPAAVEAAPTILYDPADRL